MIRSIDAPWQEQHRRPATQDERETFKQWFFGRDYLTWTRLNTRPFRLQIQADPVNCTVLHPEEDLFILGEQDILNMQGTKKT